MDKATLERLLGTGIASYRPLSGGDVNQAVYVVTLGGDEWVVKHNDTAPPGMFDAEADGLRRIAATGAIRIPAVRLVNDGDNVPQAERYIAMEFIPPGAPGLAFGRTLGQQLAQMHAAAPSPAGLYGLDRSNFLGRRPQPNTWTESFAQFYRDQRVAPVLSTARRKMPVELAARVERLQGSIPVLLDQLPSHPCLIHGDLWSGNYIAAVDGEPVLIDPAVYYGHPEIEWAYIELFGGFPAGMRKAYDAVLPLDKGYEQRRPLLQLYPVLVHVDHFGAPYLTAVDRICRTYGF